MGADTKIEWCDHTFNAWIGCTKVSPGCAHCYAETQDKFRGWTPEGWGPGKPRKRTSEAYWKDPLRWEREAAQRLAGWQARRDRASADGHAQLFDALSAVKPPRPRVFCASLADWLDDEVPIEWLADLLDLIRRTPHLDWLLLTKRPQNWRSRIEAVAAHLAATRPFDAGGSDHDVTQGMVHAWLHGVDPANVWAGTTVEDQTRADERIPHLLRIPARVRFLSCEPLLGPVDLKSARAFDVPIYGDCGGYPPPPRIDWVIAGGESGPGARPMHPDWARSLRDQCAAAGVPFLFKQWGEWAPGTNFADHIPSGTCCDFDGTLKTDAQRVWKVGTKAAGRLLDGVEHNAFPEVARG